MLNKKTVRTQDIAFKKAFTLIELLVVIAIIGILATLAVVALQQARQNARDSKRMADMKQVHTALELFYNENNRYPTSQEWESGIIESETSQEVFMYNIPSAPTPADGDCQEASNTYNYIPSNNNSSYTLLFCTGKQVSNLPAGQLCATPGGIIPCNENVGAGEVAYLSAWLELNSPIGGVDRRWNFIKSSNDGNKVLAGVNNGRLYISSDSGVNWEETSPPAGGVNRVWNSVAFSNNGNKILAGTESGFLYISSDGGNTWSEASTPDSGVNRMWRITDISSNGDIMLAGAYYGRLFISLNGGTSWVETQTPSSGSDEGWEAVKMSLDGEIMIAGIGGWPGGSIYISFDSGNSWSEILEGGENFGMWQNNIYISSDKNKILISKIDDMSNRNVYLSYDGGVNWTNISLSFPENISYYFMKEDGSKIIALVDYKLYFSSNNGLNWSELNSPLNSIESIWGMSSDGSKIIAHGYDLEESKSIISFDGGVNWSEVPAPSESGWWRFFSILNNNKVISCYGEWNLNRLYFAQESN